MNELTHQRRSAAAKHRWQNPVERERILRLQKAGKSTPEHADKIAKNVKSGVYSTRKSCPAELRQKISKGHIAGDYKGARNKCSKPCKCLETGVVYSCIREAAELTGAPQSGVSAVLNGIQQHTHDLSFEFIKKD